jgi:hypothetical protein
MNRTYYWRLKQSHLGLKVNSIKTKQQRMTAVSEWKLRKHLLDSGEIQASMRLSVDFRTKLKRRFYAHYNVYLPYRSYTTAGGTD